MTAPRRRRRPAGPTNEIGLTDADLRRVAHQFGVPDQQVRRDHAISHVLAALTIHASTDIVFFGGTALNRTYLQNGRLSEDVDLIATGNRQVIAAKITAAVESALLRVHGRVTWETPFDINSDTAPAIATTPDGVTLKIQLLDRIGYPPWPTHITTIDQRYSDAPAAALLIPTRDAFIGWKTTAWADRAAPRDLFDLWALAQTGPYPAEAVTLFRRFGPTNRPPGQHMLGKAPHEADWRAQLAGQTRLQVTAAEAFSVVQQAWTDAENIG